MGETVSLITRRICSALLILLVLAFLHPVPPVTGVSKGYEAFNTVSLKVPAVVELPNGTEIGSVSRLVVSVAYPGKGRVYFSADPLVEPDTQAAARTASIVASYLAGVNPHDYDFFARLEAPSHMVGGPSAGVALTVGFLAALLNDTLRGDVIATGMVNPDGTVGPVGGLPAKLEAAAEAGAKIFMIPAGQETVREFKTVTENVGGVVIEKTVPVTVNLTELGEKLGVRVVEVASIREAYRVFTGRMLVPTRGDTRLPSILLERLREWINENTGNATILVSGARDRLELLQGEAKTLVGGAIDRALRLINESRETMNEKPYVAASLSFQALIWAQYAYSSSHALVSGNPDVVVDGLVNETKDILSEIRRSLASLNISNPAQLEISIAVADRYHEALEAIETARTMLEEHRYYEIPSGALYQASYARWRAVTALQWLSLRQVLGYQDAGKRAETSKALREVSEFMYYYAESVVGYAETLYQDIGGSSEYLVGAEHDLSRSKKYLDSGDLYASLSFSLNSLVYATMSIYQAFSSDITAILDAARSETLDSLAKLQRVGIQPVLGLSYIEFAEYQTTPLNQLFYYELAAAYMKTIYYVYQLSLESPSTQEGQGRVQNNNEAGTPCNTSSTPPTGGGSAATNTRTQTTGKTLAPSLLAYLATALVGLTIGIVAGIYMEKRNTRGNI